MNLIVNRLSGAFGAEVRGIDLSGPAGGNLIAELRQIWLDHDGIMVVRDQQALAPAGHVALARRFGEPIPADPPDHAVPGEPALYRVDFAVAETAQPRSFVDTGSAWHADYADSHEWPGASILHVLAMPPRGGDILFADLYAAHDALSPPLRSFLAGLSAVHRSDAQVPGRAARAGMTHPLVRTHPETGRRTLFFSPGFTREIVGLAPAESRAVLAFLTEHVTQPAFILRHRWVPGDLVFWDNRCNLHYALPDYAGGGRVVFHRVSVTGAPATVRTGENRA